MKFVFTSASAIALSIASQAQAQSGSPAQPVGDASPATVTEASAADQDGVPAEDNRADPGSVILVTAQFREEDLQSTPLAITAVNAEMLDARGITNVTQVAQSAPSVTLQPTQATYGKSTSAFIRGIGQFDFIPALDPGVGIYIDEVYFGTVFGSAFDLIDTERVEILRGPQGTLAGKNSIGGAIRFFSKAPRGDGSGFLEATYGSFERIGLRGAADFAIVPGMVNARISGVAKQGGGYITRRDFGCLNPSSSVPSSGGIAPGCKLGTTGGDSILGGRIYLEATPTDRLEISLIADVTKDESEVPAETLIFAQPSLFFPGLDLSPYVPSNPFTTFSTFSAVVNPLTGENLTVEPVSRANNWGVAGIIDYELTDDLSIKSITAYREIDGLFTVDDHTPQPILQYSQGLDSRQFTQELRLNGRIGDMFTYTVGGFYFDNDISNPGRSYSFGTFDQLQNDRTESTSIAAFAHVEFDLTEELQVIGGIRYTDDKKTYSFVRSQAQATPYGLFGMFGVIEGLNGRVGTYEGDRLDWRAGLNYQVTPDIMVYAQASTGYKGGGINPRPFYGEQVVPFDPETVTSYETGVKSTLFDRALRLNMAAFHSDYDNIQLTLTSCPSLVPAGQVPLCNLVANAGSARIRGLEAEAEIEPVEDFLIDASASYLDFEYTEKSTLGTVGDAPPFTPDWKLAIGAQYRADLGGYGSITPRLDFIYQSRVYFDVANDPLASQDGYSVLNGRLTWQAPDENWGLSLAVTNITDKLYYLNKSASFFSSFGMVTGIPGRPREWSLSVNHRF
jgi:iron complex outermembrane receptor protein